MSLHSSYKSSKNSFIPRTPITPMAFEDKKTKMALIVGASKAIRYKEEHPEASENEIIQHIIANSDKILAKIDEEIY